MLDPSGTQILVSHLDSFQTGSDIGEAAFPSDVLVNPTLQTLQTELGSKEMISSIELDHSFDQHHHK